MRKDNPRRQEPQSGSTCITIGETYGEEVMIPTLSRTTQWFNISKQIFLIKFNPMFLEQIDILVSKVHLFVMRFLVLHIFDQIIFC